MPSDGLSTPRWATTTSRIRGAIFDLFHTLTGPESESVGFPTTNEVLGIDTAVWRSAISQDSRWRLAGEVRDPVQIVRTMARKIDPEISEEMIGRAAIARTQRASRALCCIPDASLDVLSTLRALGLRLALISNLDACEFAGWPRSPLFGLFDVALFSCEVGLVKPEPAIYSECLRRLGLDASECIYIGDGGGNELSGARDAGLYTILFTGVIEELWPERIPSLERSAHARIRKLSEIMSLPSLHLDASQSSSVP